LERRTKKKEKAQKNIVIQKIVVLMMLLPSYPPVVLIFVRAFLFRCAAFCRPFVLVQEGARVRQSPARACLLFNRSKRDIFSCS
jgi:hypothetical protein